MWEFVQGNWHKILVVIIALVQAWKFFIQYIRPVTHKEHEEFVIKIPKEGCVITIKPIKED